MNLLPLVLILYAESLPQGEEPHTGIPICQQFGFRIATRKKSPGVFLTCRTREYIELGCMTTPLIHVKTSISSIEKKRKLLLNISSCVLTNALCHVINTRMDFLFVLASGVKDKLIVIFLDGPFR